MEWKLVESAEVQGFLGPRMTLYQALTTNGDEVFGRICENGKRGYGMRFAVEVAFRDGNHVEAAEAERGS